MESRFGLINLKGTIMHYTVTAIYQDSEIGYGEGQHDGFAVEECIESIPGIFRESDPAGIRLIVRRSTGEIAYTTDLIRYVIATEY